MSIAKRRADQFFYVPPSKPQHHGWQIEKAPKFIIEHRPYGSGLVWDNCIEGRAEKQSDAFRILSKCVMSPLHAYRRHEFRIRRVSDQKIIRTDKHCSLS